jgi:hypothetical protein
MKITNAIAAIALAAAAACAAQDDPGPGPGPSEEGPDAGAAPSFDAAPPDATPEPPTVPQETSIDWEAASCAAACDTLGVGCAANCEEDAAAAGRANYGYFDWDFGFTRIVESVVYASCSEPVAAEVTVDGEAYGRASLACCCQIPIVTRVAGNPGAASSCTEVCADAGYAGCGDFFDWQNGGSNGLALGGQQSDYYRAATGSHSYWIATCASVPSPTHVSGSVVTTLDGFDCACY